MKLKFLILTMCLSLCLCLTACGYKNNVSAADEEYLKGLESGAKDVFVSLYNASSNNKELLSCGERWKTEHFELVFSDYQDNGSLFLKCELSLKGISIDECYEEEYMYLGIYSCQSNGEWEEVVSGYEDYYFFSCLYDYDNYVYGSYDSKAAYELYDDVQYVATIVVVDGCLYTALYLVST